MKGKKQDGASILSLGNCSILKESDIPEIESRREKAKKYGTCYCLIKPEREWINPLCMESVVGNHEGSDISKPDMFGGGFFDIPRKKPECKIISHHKTMEWSTARGKKEGLTMFSTLLCTRGGIISIEFSGQIQTDAEEEKYIEGDIEYRIQVLMNSVQGQPVESFNEMKQLSTMEILSRLLYQESRGANDDGKNAVLFSIVNRLFSTKNFYKGTKSNSVYSIITGLNQYESINKNREKYPNAFHPPILEEDKATEKRSWENAKRLAAILCIAVEDYGEPNENGNGNDKTENIIINKDEESYQNVVRFIEQQEDINNEKIINRIGKRDSFMATQSCSGKEKGAMDVCGNTFFEME